MSELPAERNAAEPTWDNRPVQNQSGSRGDEPQRGGAQTVERALAILDLFREGPDQLSLTVIARQAGLNVSTAHRLVRTLVNGGFMEQDELTERYRLGAGLAALALRAMRNAGLDRVQPILDELANSTGESISLARRSGGSVIVVLRSTSHHALKFEHPSGGALDIHASAMGKILLACGDAPPTVGDVVALGPLQRFTPSTIDQVDAFLVELRMVRERQVAFNREERYVGVCGAAVPVRDHRGTVRYALGVQGPASRMAADRLEVLAGVLAGATSEISRYVSAG